MAPKKGSKRVAAAVGAAGRPGKAARRSPQEEQLHAVAQALAAAALPDGCRAMLLAVLPTSLGAPADARHAVQARVVDMVGEALARTLADRDAAASKATEEAAAAGRRQAELQAAQAASEGAREDRAKAMQDKRAALSSADATLTEAKVTLAGRQKAELAAKEAEAAKMTECEAFDLLVAEHLCPLREGAWEEGALCGQQRVEQLQPALQIADLDASVRASLGSSGSKRASERSAFDTLVLEQVATSLFEKAAALRRELAERAPGLAEAGACVAAQASEVDTAEGAAQECRAAFEQALAQLHESEAQAKAAAQELQAFAAEVQRASQASEAAHGNLELFRAGPLAAYEALRHFDSKGAEAARAATAASKETLACVTAGGA